MKGQKKHRRLKFHAGCGLLGSACIPRRTGLCISPLRQSVKMKKVAGTRVNWHEGWKRLAESMQRTLEKSSLEKAIESLWETFPEWAWSKALPSWGK